MTNARIFYAHAAQADAIVLRLQAKALIEYLRARAQAAGRELNGVVTFGSVDHRRRFEGDWDAWAESVPTAVDTMTGNRLYNMLVVPDYAGGYVGKATAQMLNSALRTDIILQGTRCFLVEYGMDDNKNLVVEKFVPIRKVVCEDGNDFKTGWKVET